MDIVGLSEAKASLSSVIKNVRASGDPVAILRHNKPAALLCPPRAIELSDDDVACILDALEEYKAAAAGRQQDHIFDLNNGGLSESGRKQAEYAVERDESIIGIARSITEKMDEILGRDVLVVPIESTAARNLVSAQCRGGEEDGL